jgi:hypothetical protein
MIWGIVLLAVHWVTLTSAAHTFPIATRTAKLELPLRLNSSGATALSSKADQIMGNAPVVSSNLSVTARLARASLISQVLNSGAQRAYLFANALQRDRNWQLRLARKAVRSNRRDFGTHLWFIEDSAKRAIIYLTYQAVSGIVRWSGRCFN